MSLEKFIGTRLVVLSPETRIYDAVRAMQENRIGAVLVHDGTELAGIVTDRDIGLSVVGDDLDVFEFRLSDVMSAPVASVSAEATLDDVTDLMVRQHVRRVPIVDGSSVLGLVTLDDLILQHCVDISTLAAILRSQLSQPSRLKPVGVLRTPSPARAEAARRRASRRHEAHHRQAYARLLRRTLSRTGLTRMDQAEEALDIVLSALLRRVTREEAKNLLSQLPSHLRQTLLPELPGAPDLSVSRESIEEDLGERLDLGASRAAAVLQHVGEALRASISEGELDDFRSQLPVELKAILAS